MEKYDPKKIEAKHPSSAKAVEGRQKKYDFKVIEKRWQATWLKNKIYVAKDFAKRPKKFVLVEFPYPSGEGLHMGHLRPYVAGDVRSRYMRMMGNEVMFPMGWDAFGLPAENYAIKHGVQPEVSTAKNIKNAKRQMLSWGLSFDWSREVNTTDPNYYKWTQWIFLQLYKAGLAYEATGLINWCPKDKTGLANEEVIDGKCERCGAVVEKKELRQWYLKITEYAEKLLEGLKHLPEWPEAVKIQQENWIGKSEGALIKFPISPPERLKSSSRAGNSQFLNNKDRDSHSEQSEESRYVEVFTTRLDTIFSGTYVVLAPENPLALVLAATDKKNEVEHYIAKTAKLSDEERQDINLEKTGVFTGSYALNPATGEKMQIWVSDFVIGSYGTGAVFADAHDERDFEMAKKFNIPLKVSIRPKDNEEWEKVKKLEVCYTAEGTLINSGQFDGQSSAEGRKNILDWLEKKGLARRKINYRLRDWVFSRQRYWGEPIPLVHCAACALRDPSGQGIVAVPEKDLPVKLPKVKKYEPTGTGESPLAAIDKWVNTKCPKCGGMAKRETNTMPQWAGSSWYWLRYADPKNKKVFADLKKQKYWTPVDTYLGGMEHTTLHLLYSRFWNLFLYDKGVVTNKEPYVSRKAHGIILAADGEKMSKSRGNVVNPDVIVEQFGADTLRMYELFLGPHEASVSWNDRGILGVKRFLDRTWKLVLGPDRKSKEESAVLHKTIKKVGEDIENLRYNTAVSALMILLNELEEKGANRHEKEVFIKLLAPFTPHIADELWLKLNMGSKSVHVSAWPKFEPKMLVEDKINLVVQINGKVRANLEAPTGINQKETETLVLHNEKIVSLLAGAAPKRIIYVPGRLINIVI